MRALRALLLASFLILGSVGPATSQTPAGRIVFQSNRDGNPEVYIMNEDGTGQTRLTFSAPFKDAQPTISPSGTQIAFYSGVTGNLEIYVMNTDGSNIVNVTNHPAAEQAQSWHPFLAGVILFQSTRDGQPEIYALDMVTNVTLRCTVGAGRHTRPAVRPVSGDKLLFNTNEGVAPDEVWIADFQLDFTTGFCDTSHKHKFVPLPGGEWRGAWSPDGMKVVYAGTKETGGGPREVYVVDYEAATDTGINRLNISNNPSQDYAPDWSPDGTKVVFTTLRDGNREIYVMDANGANPVNLTLNPADDSQPHWGTIVTSTTPRRP